MSCIRDHVKKEVEKLFLRHGFCPTVVKLARKADDGTGEIYCYKHSELYCMITILRHANVSGEGKDWVLIEYAHSLYDAERWVFDDGDMVPLDIPMKQLIAELEEELIKSIS